jgi:hypothetical protein
MQRAEYSGQASNQIRPDLKRVLLGKRVAVKQLFWLGFSPRVLSLGDCT